MNETAANIAFTETVKADMLGQLQQHHEADEIIQDRYWKYGKGCAVGCLTHDPEGGHGKFPELFGLPEQFARLIDSVFEGLPSDVAKEWPLRVIEAVPAGAVLDQTFFDGLAVVRLHRVLSLQDLWAAGDRELVVPAIEGVILALETGEGLAEAQSAARSAAASAAEDEAASAAWYAARYAAADAAWPAAESAAADASRYAARDATRNAAWSAAQDAARSAARSAADSATRYTARSAAGYAAWSAALSAAWEQEADTIINHLQTLQTNPT